MYKGQKVVAVVDGTQERGQQALWPLGERPVLWHLLTRLESVPSVDEVLILVDEGEQEIPALLGWMGVEGVTIFYGGGGDILERVYQALSPDPPQVVVPLGVERPLFSPDYLEVMITYLIDAGLDGVHAAPEKTGITPGLDVQALRYQALVDAHLLALDPRMREEIARFIMERPQAFKVSEIQPPQSYCSQIRLLVEDEEDHEQMRQIYRAFYRPGELIDCTRVIEWLGRREVA